MSDKMITLEVIRYNPESDSEPAFGQFEIPYNDSWSVLDALAYIKDEIDSSLAYRWSCRMAVCGSCGMVINGEPKLGCETFLRNYYPGSLKIEPLANFPIERDLIVDTEDFMRKLESVKPYIIDAADNQTTLPTHANKQTPAQLIRYKQYSACINCMLCYSACPQFGLNPLFTGPAALTLGHRYNRDSRDHGKDQRTTVMQDKNGVWTCTFIGYCSEVCPKSVDPAAAIQQEKAAGTQDWALSLLLPRSNTRSQKSSQKSSNKKEVRP